MIKQPQLAPMCANGPSLPTHNVPATANSHTVASDQNESLIDYLLPILWARVEWKYVEKVD